MSTALCLVAVGLLIASLTPWLLRAQSNRGDAPRLAVLAWFAGAAAAVLSWLAGAIRLVLEPMPIVQLAGVAFGVAVTGRLAWTVGGSVRRARRQHRAHLDTARIVGRRDVRPGVLVIDVAAPAVYCVPTAGGAVVMSRGAHELLSDAEARAVLAHERTHLRERHHLIVTVASALHTAFPLYRLFSAMGPAVAKLLEMRADDAALRKHGRDTVIDALAALSLHHAPAGVMAAHGPTVLHRVHRLTHPAPPWRGRIGVAATAGAMLILTAAPLLGPWLPLCPHPII